MLIRKKIFFIKKISIVVSFFLLVDSSFAELRPEKMLKEWLKVFNSSDLKEVHEFYERIGAPQLKHGEFFRNHSGGYNLLAIERSDEMSVQALIEEKFSDGVVRIQFILDPDKPNKLKERIFKLQNQRPEEYPIDRIGQKQTINFIDQKFQLMVDKGVFSGAILIEKDGEVLLERYAGNENREQGLAVSPGTKFRLASMSKMFTAISIFQLAEQEKIDLDATIHEYLPDYPNRAIATQVTIKHLLTHTGGTGDIFDADVSLEKLRSHNEYITAFGNREPEFEPGSTFKYSNYGFIILGAIIEQVSGMSYYDYVDTYIYRKAGMTDSGSLPEEQQVKNRSISYTWDFEKNDWKSNSENLGWGGTAAGGAYSTARDLLLFAQALKDDLLITRKMKEKATKHISEYYGMGFAVVGEGKRQFFGHGGTAPGMSTEFSIYPKLGYVVIILSNLDPPSSQRLAQFFHSRIAD